MNAIADPVYRPVPLVFERLPAPEQHARLDAFQARMLGRRTVRYYSSDPVPDCLIDQALVIARSAPSGANLQPWRRTCRGGAVRVAIVEGGPRINTRTDFNTHAMPFDFPTRQIPTMRPGKVGFDSERSRGVGGKTMP